MPYLPPAPESPPTENVSLQYRHERPFDLPERCTARAARGLHHLVDEHRGEREVPLVEQRERRHAPARPSRSSPPPGRARRVPRLSVLVAEVESEVAALVPPHRPVDVSPGGVDEGVRARRAGAPAGVDQPDVDLGPGASPARGRVRGDDPDRDPSRARCALAAALELEPVPVVQPLVDRVGEIAPEGRERRRPRAARLGAELCVAQGSGDGSCPRPGLWNTSRVGIRSSQAPSSNSSVIGSQRGGRRRLPAFAGGPPRDRHRVQVALEVEHRHLRRRLGRMAAVRLQDLLPDDRTGPHPARAGRRLARALPRGAAGVSPSSWRWTRAPAAERARRGALERVVRRRDRQHRGDAADVALLDDVRQLVREQLGARRRPGRVPVRAEHHVAPDRVRVRRDRVGGCRRRRVGVHADAREVVAEPRLHVPANGRVERAPR